MAMLNNSILAIILIIYPSLGLTSTTFKKVSKEMQNELGIIESLVVDSRVHCAHYCIHNIKCVAFQIEKVVGFKKEANCVLVNDYFDAIETTTSKLDFFQNMDCRIECLNGGIKVDSTCTCQCPTTPIIARGEKCEYVCEWTHYSNMDFDPRNDIGYLATKDEQLCKAYCLSRRECFSITIGAGLCWLKVLNPNDPQFNGKIYNNTCCESFALQCNKA